MPTLRGRLEHVRDVLQEAAAHRSSQAASPTSTESPNWRPTIPSTSPPPTDWRLRSRRARSWWRPGRVRRTTRALPSTIRTSTTPTRSTPFVPSQKTSSYGPISVEFATVFTALGIRAKLVSNTDRLLPNIDGELAGLVADEFQRRRVRLVLGASADGVRRVDGRLRVTLSTGTGLDADAVLVAAGRTPNTEGLGSNRPA
jgi:NAD(P) transhydrogenase